MEGYGWTVGRIDGRTYGGIDGEIHIEASAEMDGGTPWNLGKFRIPILFLVREDKKEHREIPLNNDGVPWNSAEYLGNYVSTLEASVVMKSIVASTINRPRGLFLVLLWSYWTIVRQWVKEAKAKRLFRFVRKQHEKVKVEMKRKAKGRSVCSANKCENEAKRT
jgi:hypothetical protein